MTAEEIMNAGKLYKAMEFRKKDIPACICGWKSGKDFEKNYTVSY